MQHFFSTEKGPCVLVCKFGVFLRDKVLYSIHFGRNFMTGKGNTRLECLAVATTVAKYTRTLKHSRLTGIFPTKNNSQTSPRKFIGTKLRNKFSIFIGASRAHKFTCKFNSGCIIPSRVQPTFMLCYTMQHGISQYVTKSTWSMFQGQAIDILVKTFQSFILTFFEGTFIIQFRQTKESMTRHIFCKIQNLSCMSRLESVWPRKKERYRIHFALMCGL